MGRDTWDDDHEPFAITLGSIVLGVVIVLAIGAGIWGLGVAFSWWKGQGDAVVTKNSSDNWVNAQTQFHQDFQTYTTYKTQIDGAQKAVTDYEKRPRPTDALGSFAWQQQDDNLHTTLTGLSQQCQNTVTAYNTNSKAYLSKDFKDAGLPDQLDPAECKPVGAS